MSHQEPTPDEIYPPLPSSHTTSSCSSVHASEEREHHQKGDYESNETGHEPIELEIAPLIPPNSDSLESHLLDSQQAIPTASSFQDSATILDSPAVQASRDSSPKVVVEEGPQPSFSTLKSETLGAILGGSVAVALKDTNEKSDTLRQTLSQEEDEDFERDVHDMILDRVTYPSYDDNLDQEKDLFPQKAIKGKKNKRKAGRSRQETVQPSLAGSAVTKRSMEAVDPELLSSEAMRQIQEQDAQDAVDSWSPSVRSSTKVKRGKKGKGRSLVERLPEESGPSPNTYEPPEDKLETTVSAEGQEDDSLTREMSRKQVVDIMTAAAQDADKDESETSQSATVVVPPPVEIQAEETRTEPNGENVNKRQEGLPQDDLQQGNLPKTTVPSDDIPQDHLQTETLPPHDFPQENLARDDLPQDDLPRDELPQLEVQHTIHPEDDPLQVNPMRDDFSQSQEPQTLRVQSDFQPNSLPVLSPSSAPAIDPYSESPKAHPLSREFDRGDMITAMSPQLEFSPSGTPLPDSDDEHDLSNERLGTPTPTSLSCHDNDEKAIAAENPIDVSHTQDLSAITAGPQEDSQVHSYQADQIDAGRYLAAPLEQSPRKGKKPKQSFSVEDNETAEIQENDGPLSDVVDSTKLEDDRLKDLNDEPAIEISHGRSETVENESGGFTNSGKGMVEEEAKQSFSVENSKTTEMHQGQDSLPHIAATEVLEDHGAIKPVDESAVNVSQPKTKCLEDEWTGLNAEEESEKREEVQPNFSVENTKTTGIEEDKSLSKLVASKEPEYSEPLDLIGEPAMHVPDSGPIKEVPIELIDEISNQVWKPGMPADEWAHSESKKLDKQAEEQRSETLQLGLGLEEPKHQFEQKLDAREDLNNGSLSLATTRASQEVSAELGLSTYEASVGDEPKKAFPNEPQAEHDFKKPSEDRTFDRDGGDMPVLFELETHQLESVPGKAHDGDRNPALEKAVASTNAAQVVQDILAGENDAESATNAKSVAMATSAGMEAATTVTPAREDEMDWDVPKKKKKGKKGRKNEEFSRDEPEPIQPPEISGPPRAMDARLEQEPAADRSIEGELDRDAPKKKKKGKKGKKNEVFSRDEPEMVESVEFSGPAAAMETPLLEQEPTAKANDEVFPKQSKKDKNKKAKRKGVSKGIIDYGEEDEANAVPTESPQDEDTTDNLLALASSSNEENQPSIILTQASQDDNKAEGLHTTTRHSRDEVESGFILTETLHDNDQVDIQSAVSHPSVAGHVREEVEPNSIPTEAPSDTHDIEEFSADVMPPIKAEIEAPGEILNPVVPTEIARDDRSENSREAPLEQEEYPMPPKGKKDKKKSKKSKKSNTFSLDEDETFTLGEGQIAGAKVFENDAPEQTAPSSVDVVEESDNSVPKLRLEEEKHFTLPAKKKAKKKSKKVNALSLKKEVLPAVEDEPAFHPEDLEQEAPKETFTSIVVVAKEPGTNVESFPKNKGDRDQIEDATAQSELDPTRDPYKDSETDNSFNTTQVSGDLHRVERKREQSMPGESDSISAHATTPETSHQTSSLVTSSLEQTAGASEEFLADHANEMKGNIVPAVETNVDSLLSKNKKMAEKARPLTLEEDEASQKPRVIFNESSATNLVGEPLIMPVPQHGESRSKAEISAQKVEATEIIPPATRSEEDQGYQRSVLEETPSQARHDIQTMVEAEVAGVKKGERGERTENEEHSIPMLEEDRSPTDGRGIAWVKATSPVRRNEQTSEEQPGDDMNTTPAIRSDHGDIADGLKREQIPILAEPGEIDEAKDGGLAKDVLVQMAENLGRQQDEAQWDELKVEDSTSSVAPPRPTQESVETVRENKNVADVEPPGSLGKDETIPTMEVEMLDAKEQRDYNKEYARELERIIPNAESVADVEPLESPNIDVDNAIPAVEVEMLDAQEQRDYNEEYAKELERQLSPLQEDECADSSRDEANTSLFSQLSVPSVMIGPYEQEHRPLAQPPALEDILEEPRSRPGSVQGSRDDQEDEFPLIKSTEKAKKGKKGKKGKKKQPVIWEDETATPATPATPPLKPDIDQGVEPSVRTSEGLGSWTTDTARPLDLEEPVHKRSFEGRTIASPTRDFNTAYKKSEIENDRSGDYFALQPSIPAEEDVGMEDTKDSHRALATEPPYTSNDRSPAASTQADEDDYTRDDTVKVYSQDDGVAPLATDPHLNSRTEVEPVREKVEDDLDPARMKDTEKGTKPENKASPSEPNPQALGQENIKDLQTPTADTLNERSPSQQRSLQHPLPENELSSLADGRSTSRGKSESLEGVAAAVGLGVGALAAENLTRRDSKQEMRDGKKAKEVGSWTDSEAERGGPENTLNRLDRGDIATEEQEHRRTPASERAWQHRPAPRTLSPPSTNHDAVADHSIVENLGRSSETPEYRDSAIYVSGSPIISEETPYHHAARDSGYPDTEAGPPIDDENENLSDSTKLEGSVAASEMVGHVQHRNSRTQETERQVSSSRNPLEISVEASSDDDVSVSRPRERRKRSRRRSGVAYDSDDSADSGFDVQRRRRRQAVAAEPREPSPVSSTTKDRSSALFDSSPSAREAIAAKPQDRGLSTHYDTIGEKPTWSFDREGSPQQQSRQVSSEGRTRNSPEVAPELTGHNTSAGHDEAAGTSLFGGPRSYDDDDMTSPSRSPRSSEGRGRRRLNTISEDSADGLSLNKKDKRALSDVGSPESGVKGRRMRSPPIEGDVAGEHVFTHGPMSRQPRPAAEEDKDRIEERSRSRNSDQQSSLSSRHSGRAGVTFGQREEEYRTGSAGSMHSEKNSMNSIHAIIRTPDQVRSASGLSYRSEATPTPPLRRVDRSASGDLRGASRKDQAKSRAKTSSEFHPEPEPELDFATTIPSSSTYDPVTDKGKSRADMTDVYVSWQLCFP